MTATPTTRRPGDVLDAATHMGPVELRVSDRRAMEDFYVRGVGLTPLSSSPRRTVLGLDGRVVVTLTDAPDLRRPSRRAAGLFHTAVLFASERELAASLVRMFVRYPETFEGPGDHLVSQAFYFTDPEGNGVELYADRPRETWTWENGLVVMDTLSIDPNAFLMSHLGVSGTQRALDAARSALAVPAGREVSADDGLQATGQVGHVHLQVGDVATARAFYVDALGFEVTSEMAGSALFVSAGGYHHPMAMNVWNSRGAGPRGATLGLGQVDIALPDDGELAAIRERVTSHGVTVDDDGARLLVRDPWNNELRLAVNP